MKEAYAGAKIKGEIKTKSFWKSKAEKRLARTVLFSVFGFVISRASIFQGYYPFGVAYIAALPINSFFAFVATCFGYMFTGNVLSALKYIASATAIYGIRWTLSGKHTKKIDKHLLFAPVVSFLTVTAVSLTSMSVSKSPGYLIVMSIAEGLIAGAAAFFMKATVKIISSSRQLHSLNSKEIVTLAITIGIFLIALQGISISGISIGRMAAVLLILICAKCGKESAGCITGVAYGAMLGLGSNNVLALSATYGFGGLLAGLFAPVGKISVILSFLVSNLIVGLSTGMAESYYSIIAESCIMCGVFLIIPNSVFMQWERYFSKGVKTDIDTASSKIAIANRLKNSGKIFGEISSTVEEVSSKLKELGTKEQKSLSLETKNNICMGCGMKLYCWQVAEEKTNELFDELEKTLKNKGSIKLDDMPEHFKTKCPHLTTLRDSLNENYVRIQANESISRRVEDIKSVVVQQFAGLAEILDSTAQEIETIEAVDDQNARLAEMVLIDYDLLPLNTIATVDSQNRLTLNLTFSVSNHIKVNRSELVKNISIACERNFDVPCINVNEDRVNMVLTEKAVCSVTFGVAQHNFNNSSLCGDSYECFTDGKGNAVMLLSDGMGCGGYAAVDSAMTTKLLSKLIVAGVGYNAALKMVNSAMMVKSSEESLATVDLGVVNLFTGKTEILKAGAFPTIIRKSGRCIECNKVSLPAGILKDVSFEKETYNLTPGDIVVIMSDGAINGGIEWIEATLESYTENSPQKLAEYLVEEVRRRRGDNHEDDITIMVAMLGKGI